MRTRSIAVVVALALAAAAAGCGKLNMLKGQMALKDAHTAYRTGDYPKAVVKYEEALSYNPDLDAVYFYLANAYDNLYKPARKGQADNDANLNNALKYYKLATEKVQDPKLRKLSFEYLLATYGPDKLNDPSQAEPIVQKMIEMEPTEPANYFALAKIYEDAGRYDEAEQTLIKARDARPSEPSVYMQLAGYYNRQGQFDKTIEALKERARQEPNNPEAHYTIATFYWDKSFRDFRLKDDEKRGYIAEGLAAVDKALAVKGDYIEALVYKGLLLRLQANLEKDRDKQQALLKEADGLRDKAQTLRKQKAAGAGD